MGAVIGNPSRGRTHLRIVMVSLRGRNESAPPPLRGVVDESPSRAAIFGEMAVPGTAGVPPALPRERGGRSALAGMGAHRFSQTDDLCNGDHVIKRQARRLRSQGLPSMGKPPWILSRRATDPVVGELHALPGFASRHVTPDAALLLRERTGNPRRSLVA
jgi:hypothetical protein